MHIARGGGGDPVGNLDAFFFLLAQVSDWEAVVYGKTEDQLIMTEQARQYLNPYPASGSTSRALVL